MKKKGSLELAFEDLLRTGAKMLVQHWEDQIKNRSQRMLDGVQRAEAVVTDAREAIHEQCRQALGVTKDAPLSVIKAAFRALSKEHHPDAGGDRTVFERIKAAYDVLVEEHEKRGK